MSDTKKSIPHDNTFYTTPKMVAGSISADVLWQIGSQYIDPRFEDSKVGAMDYEWFAAFIYPIVLMIVIGGIARAHSRYVSGYTSEKKIPDQGDDETKKDYDERVAPVKLYNKNLADSIEEDKAIAGGIVFGILGWMLGYVTADEDLGYGFNEAQTALAVGIGSTITVLMYSLYTDKKNNNVASKGTYAVASASFFLDAVGWYLCYILPDILAAKGFENKMATGFVSAIATGVASAASLGVLYLWVNKEDKNASKNVKAASSPSA